MLYKIHKKFESIYKKLTSVVPQATYRIVEQNDTLAKDLCPQIREPFVSAVVGATYSTASIWQCGNLIIPKGSQIVQQRFFRYCTHNGSPHLNANDLLLFPEQNGNIVAISSATASDHYKSIVEFGGLNHISEAYFLPKEKAGSLDKYVENGASIPIIVDLKELPIWNGSRYI